MGWPWIRDRPRESPEGLYGSFDKCCKQYCAEFRERQKQGCSWNNIYWWVLVMIHYTWLFKIIVRFQLTVKIKLIGFSFSNNANVTDWKTDLSYIQQASTQHYITFTIIKLLNKTHDVKGIAPPPFLLVQLLLQHFVGDRRESENELQLSCQIKSLYDTDCVILTTLCLPWNDWQLAETKVPLNYGAFFTLR